MGNPKSFDERYDRRLEIEPTYRPRHVRIPLSSSGTLRSYITRRSLTRCSVCERGVAPGVERCAVCESTNARRVECGCGYLAEHAEHDKGCAERAA